MTRLSVYSFLLFNLLCAPCFAAIGAIRRKMNSAKWTLFAIMYQCVFAYCVSLVVYQLGMLFTGTGNVVGVTAAAAIIAFAGYMLGSMPEKEESYVSLAFIKCRKYYCQHHYYSSRGAYPYQDGKG